MIFNAHSYISPSFSVKLGDIKRYNVFVQCNSHRVNGKKAKRKILNDSCFIRIFDVFKSEP